MEKFKLNNGMSVVYAGFAKCWSGVLSVNVGHVNEPKLGIANLFERTLLLQIRGILPVFGGSMTAYTAGGMDLEDVMQKLQQVFNQTVVNDEYVEQAKQLIRQQTEDTAPMTMRRMKLEYKHVAFGEDLVKTKEEYLSSLFSHTTEDVREFANTYYTANNIVLVIAGPKVSKRELKNMAETYFGSVSESTEITPSKSNIYTGGFGKIEVKDCTSRLMFGWDMSNTTVDDSPVINVLMSMFLRRLERAFADLDLTDVQVDLKIAGYYGLRTIRVYLASPTLSNKALSDVFV
ncbi:MAG: insulinase family protein, partial [Alphaproteobacteria bacterium]|nr:insulinase family protein [Alphaproteobacteria bacterium]